MEMNWDSSNVLLNAKMRSDAELDVSPSHLIHFVAHYSSLGLFWQTASSSTPHYTLGKVGTVTSDISVLKDPEVNTPKI